ncbi:MAG: DNA mismatch repair protein MutS [Acidobacteria bacterium]|nr:DNA mismatch repair protein MutS [Acidobacteriota bacterium]MBV9475628.1 DNA mismatch repair protein MutS [Acidobacteriota bacterium]
MANARELYSERAAARQAEVVALRARERRVSTARLVAVALAIGIAWWAVAWAIVPVAVFIALVFVHERVVRRRMRAEKIAAFYARGLARLDGRWAGGGDAGSEFADDHHPYAGDFDLFGRGSLFELISLAITKAGRARLATWLKTPATAREEIVARQQAVAELRDAVELREDVAVEAADVAHDIESARLDAWAALPPVHFAAWERIAALVFPAINVVLLVVTLPSLVAKMLGEPATFPLSPLLFSVLITLTLGRWFAPRVKPLVAEVERAEPALALLGALLARLERERFTSPRLTALAERLRGADDIERLRKLVALLDARRNQFFAALAELLLWTTNVGFAIERWRLRSGARIGDWIEAVGEVEALSSLASFAFEHPSFATPEIVAEGPLFDARDLGHPLIPDDRRVTNDLRLDAQTRLLLVSGSNMSGKSTMMRSVGIAAVLAMTGGPVCASALRIAPAQVGASIRIHDSLQENASRFYAEILRIRQVLELATRGPLLFLLDEVLAGTNSHDRRIGAEGIVRNLVARGGAGLVSTHDLALAQIAETLPGAANVHFEDRVEEGQVVFDYRMRPGIVTKSNALELMRSVGIDV